MDFFRSIGISEPVFQFMLVNALLGLSVYLTLITGMFSLANAGFMAIGAFTGAILIQTFDMPLIIGLIGGMVAGGLVAIPVGLPVLRLRDIYLAIATIGFGEIVRITLLNMDQVASSIVGERVEITGGALGIKQIPKITETWHLLLLLALAVYFIWRLQKSRFGRAMAAVRQDERAAANMGVNVVYTKNVVFIFSAMLAAAAGVMSAHLTRIISPADFGFNQAVDILAFAVLGGTSTVFGPIVGAFLLTALPEVLRFTNEYRGIINGAILLLVIIYLPGGLVNPEGLRRVWRKFRPAPPNEATVNTV